jgi:hypothetical protein
VSARHVGERVNCSMAEHAVHVSSSN